MFANLHRRSRRRGLGLAALALAATITPSEARHRWHFWHRSHASVPASRVEPSAAAPQATPADKAEVIFPGLLNSAAPFLSPIFITKTPAAYWPFVDWDVVQQHRFLPWDQRISFPTPGQ